MREVHEMGVPIAVISHEDDRHFNMDRLQQTASNAEVTSYEYPDGSTGYVDGWYVARGSHDSLYVEPDKYTTLAETAISALEAKQRRSSSGSFRSDGGDRLS